MFIATVESLVFSSVSSDIQSGEMSLLTELGLIISSSL